MTSKHFSILVTTFVLVLLATVSHVGAATVGKTITGASTDSLRNGLVGHWTFDGKNMISNVADSSGNGNNGKMSGFTSTSSAVTAGKVGQAIKLDGVNDIITVNHSASLNPPNAISITFWLNASLSGGVNGSLVAKNVSTDYRIRIISNNVLQFLQNGSGVLSSNNNIYSPNQWVHITLTSDSSGTTFYKNGVVFGTNGTAYIPPSSSGSLIFNVLMPVNMDDIRIYNRTLSISEIQQLYSQGSAKVASTVSRPAQTGLSSGLVGHWTFDGKNMISNVADSSGSGNNGMMSGFTSTSSAVTAGKVGQGLGFDGVNDYVDVGNSSVLDFPDTSFSYSFWFNSNTVQARNVLSNRYADSSVYTGYSIYFANGTPKAYLQMRFIDGVDHSYTVSSTIEYNKWYHVAVVWDRESDTVNAYVNGVQTLAPTSIVSVGSIPKSSSFKIGRGEKGYLRGFVDDVRVYSRVLSATEIKQLYSQGSAKVASTISRPAQTGLSSGLVGHWTFDGKNMISNVADSSGSGNNGMMSGFTSTSSAVTAGKVGQGLGFDGVNDYVSIADHSSLEGMSSLTISAWVKAVNTGTGADQDILNKGDIGLVPYALRVSGSTGKMNFYVANSSAYANPVPISNSIIPFGIWTHFVGTYDGSTAKLYLNGQLQTTTGSLTGNVNTNSSILAIGRQGPSSARYVSGSLDDVRVYNRALSASEVQQLYNMSK